MTDKTKATIDGRLIYVPLQSRMEMVRLFSISTIISMGLFAFVGWSETGWSVFTLAPLVFFMVFYAGIILNLFALHSPKIQLWASLVVAGPGSPVVLVALAGYTLVAFGESVFLALSIVAAMYFLLFLFGISEGNNCEPKKTEAFLRSTKALRTLPDGRDAFAPQWKWAMGAEAVVPGLGARKWVDRAVIAFAFLALPIGAADAFTSANSIADIPVQWKIMTAFLVVAWLLRPLVTAAFGQLSCVDFLNKNLVRKSE